MPSPRSALLFDLDGTIVDTDPLHFQAFQILLARFGRTVDHDDYRATIQGESNDAVFGRLFPDLAAAQRAGLAEEKEALFRGLATGLTARAGLRRLLGWAAAGGVGTALVTNAQLANVEAMLGALDLVGRFDVIVPSEELPRAKPDPLPYREALARLGVAPDRALAFEDSIPGLQSASGAEIETVGIVTLVPEAAMRQAGASRLIRDFDDASLWARLETLGA